MPYGLDILVTQAPGGTFSHDGDLYYGWDFVLGTGTLFRTDVLAVADGTVVFVEESVPDGGPESGSYGDATTPRDPSLGPSGALGNVVTLAHEIDGQTFFSSYLHLAQGSVTVSPGDSVSAGQAIGEVGNTGVRSGTHLHLNIGETLGGYTNGSGQHFTAYQIAEGPDDAGRLLELVDFADSPRSDGQLPQGTAFASTTVPAEIRSLATVEFQPGPDDGSDLSTASFYAPYGRDADLLLVDGWADYYYSFVRFDLTDLPAEAASAEIQLYSTGLEGVTGVFPNIWRHTEILVDVATGPWSEEFTTWFNQPSGTNIAIVPSRSGEPQWVSIDVTDAYNAWQAGDLENNGIILRPATNYAARNQFYSSDYEVSELRPKLVVTYDASMSEPVNRDPAASGTDRLVQPGSGVPLSQLFDWSDPDGADDVTAFAVRDRTDGGGYLTKDGVRQADDVLFDLQPIRDVDRWAFVAGASGIADEIGFNAIDNAGAFNSPSAVATVTANTKPVVSAVIDGPTTTVPRTDPFGSMTTVFVSESFAPGDLIPLGDFVTITDADGLVDVKRISFIDTDQNVDLLFNGSIVSTSNIVDFSKASPGVETVSPVLNNAFVVAGEAGQSYDFSIWVQDEQDAVSNIVVVEYTIGEIAPPNAPPDVEPIFPQPLYEIGAPIIVANLFTVDDPDGLDDVDQIVVTLPSGDGYFFLQGGNGLESPAAVVTLEQLQDLRFVARNSSRDIFLRIEAQDTSGAFDREDVSLGFEDITGWQAVRNAISFPQFFLGDLFGAIDSRPMSDSEQMEVLRELATLYESSPTRRTTLDNFIANGGTFSLFGSDSAIVEFVDLKSQLPIGITIPVNSGILINIDSVESKEYLNVQGGFTSVSLGQALYHEMLHAIDHENGDSFPEIEDKDLTLDLIPYDDPEFDHLGHVVRGVNSVRADLGVPLRGSYKPTLSDDAKAFVQDLQQYVPWTFDQAIVFQRAIGSADPQVFRSDGVLPTSDLIYGFNTRNDIRTGEGYDMVFGGPGKIASTQAPASIARWGSAAMTLSMVGQGAISPSFAIRWPYIRWHWIVPVT